MRRIGIIPFDVHDEAVHLLFVTSQTRGRWIFPKGRSQGGESHAETCHREGFEEAGVHGDVLEKYPLSAVVGRQTCSGIEEIPVVYYPYLVQELVDEWPEKGDRRRRWVLVDEASKFVHWQDLLGVVEQVQPLVPRLLEEATQRR